MTKEIIDKLITHYKRVIEEIGKLESLDIIKDVLTANNVQHGICYCSLFSYYIYIVSDDWVNSFPSFPYWFDKPKRATTKEEVINLLQLRVDRLMTFE